MKKPNPRLGVFGLFFMVCVFLFFVFLGVNGDFY